jgi:hypothetical protein
MSTRNAEGKPQGVPTKAPAEHEAMQAAYQAHTLAQMLYGQLATSHPWRFPTSPLGMQHRPPDFQPQGWSPYPFGAATAQGCQGPLHYHSVPWGAAWPQMYGPRFW